MPTLDVSPADLIKPTFDLLRLHPIASVIAIIILTLFVSAAIFILILFSNSEIREFIRDLYVVRREEGNAAAHRQLMAERDSADEALRSTAAQLELAKLAFSIAEDSIQRFNRIRFAQEAQVWTQATIHLLDWIQRVFSFTRSDINKVTLWTQDANDETVLIPAAFTGVSPESAVAIRLPVRPDDPAKDTFAAMAFRSKAIEVCNDTETDARYHHLSRVPRFPYRSLIAVPILTGDRLMGVLTIDSLFAETFAAEDALRFASISAGLLALFLRSDRIQRALPEGETFQGEKQPS